MTKLCGYCSKDISDTKPSVRYCDSKCRQAAEKRRKVERATGQTPGYRGPNTGRSYDTDYVRTQKMSTNKIWRAANGREYHLKTTYGIGLEQYEQLLEQQNHCCKICQRHSSEFKRRLAVDHNHFTGEIRGLLCDYCNRRIVGRHRDGDLLRKVADYIEQGTGWFVPKKRPRKKRPKSSSKDARS